MQECIDQTQKAYQLKIIHNILLKWVLWCAQPETLEFRYVLAFLCSLTSIST